MLKLNGSTIREALRRSRNSCSSSNCSDSDYHRMLHALNCLMSLYIVQAIYIPKISNYNR